MDVTKYKAKLAESQILAQNGQCRLWTGATKDGRGTPYGTLHVLVAPGRWRNLATHRLSLQFDRGWGLEDMDDMKEGGMVVSHLCHNSLCLLPQHLSMESDTVNGRRAYCVHTGHCTGHQHDPDCLLNLRM